MKLPSGQENELPKYAPERRVKLSKKPNPHGYLCQNCKQVIEWVYRNGELWLSPRFFCYKDHCQKAYSFRSSLPDDFIVDRRKYRR